MKKLMSSAVLVASTSLALPASPLNILLSNDDGYGSYGITQMAVALRADGHRVYVSAPATEQSGKSGSITGDTRASILYTEKVPGLEWSIGTEEGPATPADAVNAGLNALTPDVLPRGEHIDLVVSGVNDGENISRLTNGSGTLGGAMWALRRGVPSIAVSAGQDIGTLRAIRDCPPPPAGYKCIRPLLQKAEANAQAAADTAIAYTLAVLDQLDDTGMPDGLGLSINVPSGAFTPLGARLTRSDNQQAFDLIMQKKAEGELLVDGQSSNDILAALVSGYIDPRACLQQGSLPITIDFDSEGMAFSCAHITVSILNGNFDASQDKTDAAEDLACSLKNIATPPSFFKCRGGNGHGHGHGKDG